MRESNEGLIEHYSDTGAGGLDNARPTIGDRRQPKVGYLQKLNDDVSREPPIGGCFFIWAK